MSPQAGTFLAHPGKTAQQCFQRNDSRPGTVMVTPQLAEASHKGEWGFARDNF